MKIVEFEEKYLTAAAALEDYAPDPWTRAQLESELMCDAAVMLVAVSETDELYGFCAFQCAAGEGSLNAITISAHMRGKGIATELLLYAFATINADEIYLEVRSQNYSAIKLYEKLKFARVGVRRGFYNCPNDDAIVMKLILKEPIC